MEKLPPYGRQVSRILKTPRELAMYFGCNAQRATVWIATGPDAWAWKREHPLHLALVLPQTNDPAEFNWSPLAGHEPILIHGPDAEDIERRRAIAFAMFRDGVTAVLAGRVLMKTHDHISPRKAA